MNRFSLWKFLFRPCYLVEALLNCELVGDYQWIDGSLGHLGRRMGALSLVLWGSGHTHLLLAVALPLQALTVPSPLQHVNKGAGWGSWWHPCPNTGLRRIRAVMPPHPSDAWNAKCHGQMKVSRGPPPPASTATHTSPLSHALPTALCTTSLPSRCLMYWITCLTA